MQYVAEAIHHELSGFITQDRQLLRGGDLVRKEFGLEILAASDIVPDPVNVSVAKPLAANVGASQIAIREMSEMRRPGVRIMLNTISERPELASKVLPPDTKLALEISATDSPIGLASVTSQATETSAIVANLIIQEFDQCEWLYEHL